MNLTAGSNSRNGNPFSSFSGVADAIAASVPHVQDAVMDGEIVCLNKRGHPQFKDLLFRRGEPCFFAFDLLTCDGKDLRTERQAAANSCPARQPH